MRFILPLFIAALLFFSCNNGEKHDTVRTDTVTVDSTPLIRKKINADLKEKMLDTFFQKRMDEDRFSGSVLIAQHGIILYQKTFGWANREKRERLSPDHPIQLASVSKQFTAAAVMLLHQQGKIQYDDSVKKYLPDFPYPGVTIRHLLTHRAGLDKYTNICDNYYREKKCDPAAFSNDSAMAIMKKECPKPYRKPDTKFEYSNTGYMYLASLVEKVSGVPFYLFMKVNFFIPLKMSKTFVATDPSVNNNAARCYFGKWKWWEDNYLDSVTGDKGIYSTAEDMYKWDRALTQYSILKKEILEEAYKPYSPELTEKKYWNYGFGWRTVTFDDGARAVFHNGWWHGYTTTFYRGLSDGVTIIILCNKFNKGIYNVTPILSILQAHHQPLPDDENAAEDTTPAAKQQKCAVPVKKKKRK